MGLKLVIERECSRDHQTALRQFLCCEPGGPEWAMDPQRYIRDLSVRKTPKGIMRTLLVVSGDIPLEFTPQERGNYFGSTLAFF